MTLDELAAVAETRIPTPAEFLAFVRGQGWEIKAEGGKGWLRGDASDPLIRSVARMFSREPWRTNVLKLVAAPPAPEPQPAPEPELAKVFDQPGWRLDGPSEPAPTRPQADRPTGRPAGHDIDPDGQMIRDGVCVARRDSRLAWADYRAGVAYWFEEWRLANGTRPPVASFRVFGDAGGAGFAGPSKFADLFTEEGNG